MVYLFPYIGGKSQHVKWIEEYFPKEFETYVEVFGGAGWILLKSQKLDGKKLVYNDLNIFLANAFECFRSSPKELLNEMNRVPTSDAKTFRQFQNELYGEHRQYDDIELGDVSIAMKYLYLQTQIFSGTPLSAMNTYYFCDTKSNGKYRSKYETLKSKLANERILKRLSSIMDVESLDFQELIRKYDSPTTFFYCDPPYYNHEKYYSQDFPKEQHRVLADTLHSIRGKYALSYYDFDDIRDLYSDSYFIEKEVYRPSATRSSRKKDYSEKSKGNEILIRNYN